MDDSLISTWYVQKIQQLLAVETLADQHFNELDIALCGLSELSMINASR